MISIDRWPFKTGFTVTYKCYFLQDFIYANFVNELASINVISSRDWSICKTKTVNNSQVLDF